LAQKLFISQSHDGELSVSWKHSPFRRFAFPFEHTQYLHGMQSEDWFYFRKSREKQNKTKQKTSIYKFFYFTLLQKRNDDNDDDDDDDDDDAMMMIMTSTTMIVFMIMMTTH
jgi:hypothetical protein